MIPMKPFSNNQNIGYGSTIARHKISQISVHGIKETKRAISTDVFFAARIKARGIFNYRE